MHTLPYRFATLLATCALACLSMLAAPALADDTEIFSAASGGTIGPNIMFIIDTSGSMSTTVETQAPYDSTASYPVTLCNNNSGGGGGGNGNGNGNGKGNGNGNCNNNSNGCTAAFDETAVYWVQGTGGSLPNCSSTAKVPRAQVNCVSGASALDVSTGYMTDALVQWKHAGTAPNDSYAWTPTLKTSVNQTYMACHGDYPSTGPWPTTATTGTTGSLTTPAYTSTSGLVYWINGAATQTTYTLYSGKYLNYAYYGTVTVLGSRLSVVQTAASSLVNSLANVNIGLMRYSDNSNNQTPCINQGALPSSDCVAQGGMVTFPITPIATGRSSFLSILTGYQSGGYTPLSETMYEAMQYFSGGPVVFGDTSYVGSKLTPSVAASRVGNALTSHTYLSPMQYSCQKNFIVFLTDGLPTQDNEADTLITALPNEATLGGPCDNTSLPPYSNLAGGWGPSTTAGKCLSALTKYMFNADLNAGLAGQQNIQTYFVGFGNDPGLAAAFSYLQSAATKGGGQAFTAGDQTSLQTALTAIVSSILQISTTFTAPTVAVNAFNRTQTMNDLYVSVFQPATTYHWPGNVKRYLLQNGAIVDQNGLAAVDPTTGFFKSSAQSFWSTSVDGSTIAAGGTANMLPNWDSTQSPHRNIYTYIGANPGSPVDLTSNASYNFVATNPLLNNVLLGVTTAAAAVNVVNYIRGEDLRDVNANGQITDTSHAMGDPLHAEPAAVIYGGTTGAPDATDGVLFAAENDGMIHAFDTKTGVELWSFIPQDVIPQLRATFANAPATSKHYALDGSVRVLKYDVNGDGIIDPAAGDRVIIYFGQGRGGSNYYAIDVTNRYAPKFMWEIGPSQLPGIGQAWSNPALAKVNVAGGGQTSVQKLVLIFAAGYDISEETQTYAKADTVGMGLYMVDVVTGSLLWSAGPATSTASLKLTRMDHSIPADIAVLDTNGDGYADRMYVGDLGGQLWRFDIWNGQPPATLVTGGVIASLGAHDLSFPPALTDTRRFYNTPDAAVIEVKGQPPYMNIAIGSGYRGHPLYTGMQDRMYSVRDYNPFTQLTQATYDAMTPLTDAGLQDITNTVPATLAAGANGWKLLLETAAGGWIGEKVLVPATTINNQILFTTYTPNMSASTLSCQPTLGLNKFYAISVVDGSPVANLNNLNNTAPSDRSTNLAQGGIAPSLAFLFPASTPATDAAGNPLPTNTQSPVICMSGVEILGACKAFKSRLKTYWNEADAP